MVLRRDLPPPEAPKQPPKRTIRTVVLDLPAGASTSHAALMSRAQRQLGGDDAREYNRLRMRAKRAAAKANKENGS